APRRRIGAAPSPSCATASRTLQGSAVPYRKDHEALRRDARRGPCLHPHHPALRPARRPRDARRGREDQYSGVGLKCLRKQTAIAANNVYDRTDHASPMVSMIACASGLCESASPNTMSKWLVPGIGTKPTGPPRAITAAMYTSLCRLNSSVSLGA